MTISATVREYITLAFSLSIIIMFLGTAFHPVAAMAVNVATPYDVEAIRAEKIPSNRKNKTYTCPSAIEPILQLNVESAYCKDDPTRSTICEDEEAELKAKTEKLTEFTFLIGKLANDYAISPAPNPEIATCMLTHLRGWAQAGALAPGDAVGSKTGEYFRATALGSVASAFAVVRHDSVMQTEESTAVKQWISSLAQAVITHFDSLQAAGYDSARSNHRYWAGFAVASSAMATDNPSLLGWAYESYRIGLKEIQSNGTLPLELERGSKDFEYHLHAITPLVMIAEIGTVNGTDLYAENGKALHKLTRLVAKLLHHFSYKAFKGKTHYSKHSCAKMSWLEPFVNRWFSKENNPDLKAQAKDLLKIREHCGGKLYTTGIGGNMTHFFGRSESALKEASK